MVVVHTGSAAAQLNMMGTSGVEESVEQCGEAERGSQQRPSLRAQSV